VEDRAQIIIQEATERAITDLEQALQNIVISLGDKGGEKEEGKTGIL
jgi:hypothetical protein